MANKESKNKATDNAPVETPEQIIDTAKQSTYVIGGFTFRLCTEEEMTAQYYDIARPVISKMEKGEAFNLSDFKGSELAEYCSGMIRIENGYMDIMKVKEHLTLHLTPSIASKIFVNFHMSNMQWLSILGLYSRAMKQAVEQAV